MSSLAFASPSRYIVVWTNKVGRGRHLFMMVVQDDRIEVRWGLPFILYSGVEQRQAHQPHKLGIAGSSPVPATKGMPTKWSNSVAMPGPSPRLWMHVC